MRTEIREGDIAVIVELVAHEDGETTYELTGSLSAHQLVGELLDAGFSWLRQRATLVYVQAGNEEEFFEELKRLVASAAYPQPANRYREIDEMPKLYGAGYE